MKKRKRVRFRPRPHESGYFWNRTLFNTNRPSIYTKTVNPLTETALKPLSRVEFFWIRRVWRVREDDWNRIFLNQLRHKLGSRLTCELQKFKVEANNPLSTFAPDEWIGLYLVISLWHSHLRSVWNVTLKHWNWEGNTASEITPLARVQLQLQTAVAYACECVKPDTPLQI